MTVARPGRFRRGEGSGRASPGTRRRRETPGATVRSTRLHDRRLHRPGARRERRRDAARRREYGFDRLREQIAQNVAQARALAGLVDAAPELALLAPVGLDVVCFRDRPAGAPEDAPDALNRVVLCRLQERGIAVPAATRLGGRYAPRVANVNHRSRTEDFDAVRAIATEVAAEVATERGRRGA